MKLHTLGMVLVGMLISCGQDDGLKSIGGEIDKGWNTLYDNGAQFNAYVIEKRNAAEKVGDQKVAAAEHKGDLAVDHVKRGGYDANMAIIEKRDAAEKKGDQNGKATEKKFHETKDSLTKRATGFDRDEQAEIDAKQDSLLDFLVEHQCEIWTLPVEDGIGVSCGGGEEFVIIDGSDGSNGIDGINGTDGVDGTKGAKGRRGRKGNKGRNGSDGADGTNGTDGADGVDGTDGQSCNVVKTIVLSQWKASHYHYHRKTTTTTLSCPSSSYELDVEVRQGTFNY